MKQAVVINGVPASGKSTIAAQLLPMLSAAGSCPVPLSLDTVKEGLFAQIGTGDRDYNRMLGRASYHAIFNTIAEFRDDLVAVIDAWHGFQPRQVLEEHLSRAHVDRVIEVWVSVRPETAAARYRDRSGKRHAGHLPVSYADELFELARTAQPFGIGEVVVVDGEADLPTETAAQVIKLLSA